jgi:hypothetical protein
MSSLDSSELMSHFVPDPQIKKSPPRGWAESISYKEVEETGLIMMRCGILIQFIFGIPVIPLVNITGR